MAQDDFEASRSDKLRAIEALGLDPWGGRFDGHQSIADILALPEVGGVLVGGASLDDLEFEAILASAAESI